jgi:tetratricopeptide (TPR) repeat protein
MRRSIAHLVVGALAAAAVALAALWIAHRTGSPRIEDILAACREGAEYGGLTIAYPLDEALFPPGIVPPTFRWEDGGAESDTWLVTIRFPDGGERLSRLARAREWTPSDQDWGAIQRRSTGEPADVTVLGFARSRPTRILTRGTVSIGTSGDEVGAPLFYREVNLPFIEAVKDPTRIRWRFAEVSSRRPAVVLENLPVCGNCHSFCADGCVLGMDVDYANDKGSYVTTPVAEEIILDRSKIITWSDYEREDGEPTFGLLSQVSPDGRYVVSTVKDRSVFVPKPGLAYSQLFFPIRGILAVYDRRERTFRALPGADDRELVQSNPSWSPDGKYIVFARSTAYRLKKLSDENRALLTMEECEEFLKEGKTFLFDLYRIPFNGGKGGPAEPLEGASNNGMSNFFAKYSPDGRWIVFCKAKSFMLLQPDSELYIIPAEGGEARRMRCNTSRMNSWHSWSPNGKWLVFSSKLNGPYTQLLLAHVDAEGRSSPPVVLDHFTAADRAANIPEFVNARPGAISRIHEQFVDDVSYVRAGQQYVIAGDPNGAAQAYRKALELNPRNAEARLNLGTILKVKGILPEAESHFAKLIEYDPNSGAAHAHLADVLVLQERHPEAIAHYRRAARLLPQDARTRCNLGAILLKGGRHAEAASFLAEAIHLDPNSARAHRNLGQVYLVQGKASQAARHLSEAVRLDPNDATALHNLGLLLYRTGRTKDALAHLAKAARLKPDFKKHYLLGGLFAERGQWDRAAVHYEQALKFNPDDPRARNNLATTLLRQGKARQAAVQYRHLLRVRPDDVPALMALASILTSAEDRKLRSGEEATAYATRACELTRFKSPMALRILAAAYAEAGRLNEAVRAATKALNLARAAGQEALARDIARQIKLYEQTRAPSYR